MYVKLARDVLLKPWSPSTQLGPVLSILLLLPHHQDRLVRGVTIS